MTSTAWKQDGVRMEYPTYPEEIQSTMQDRIPTRFGLLNIHLSREKFSRPHQDLAGRRMTSPSPRQYGEEAGEIKADL